MSIGRFLARGCAGKIKLRQREAERKATRLGADAYECPVCGYWHTGTLHKREGGARRGGW